MKKFYLIIVAAILFVVPGSVFASNASIAVSSSNTVMVGNSLTVTVTLSSSSKIGSWQVNLNYDKNYLKLTSSSAEAGGTYMASTVPNGTKSQKYTFKFTALKSGSAKVSVDSFSLYDYDTMEAMKTTGGSKTITIKTKEEIEASYSSNAYLKSLSVGNYALTPAFKKDTREYKVEVPNDVLNVTINATKDDASAEISGLGEKTLVEGNNKFNIVVTAQKGNSLTYVLNVVRKELNPISVTIKGENYSIIRKEDVLPKYKTFVAKTIMYENEEIPALYSEVTNTTLVGVTDSDGRVKTFSYDNGFKDEYVEFNNNPYSLVPLPLKKSDVLSSYDIKTIQIDGVSVEAYVIPDSDYVVIYAQNVDTGDISYYSYLKNDETFQIYNKKVNELYEARIKNYKYIFYSLVGFIVVLLILLILKKPKRHQNIVKTLENDISSEIKRDIKETNPKTLEKNKKMTDKFMEEIDVNEIKLVRDGDKKDKK